MYKDGSGAYFERICLKHWSSGYFSRRADWSGCRCGICLQRPDGLGCQAVFFFSSPHHFAHLVVRTHLGLFYGLCFCHSDCGHQGVRRTASGTAASLAHLGQVFSRSDISLQMAQTGLDLPSDGLKWRGPICLLVLRILRLLSVDFTV